MRLRTPRRLFQRTRSRDYEEKSPNVDWRPAISVKAIDQRPRLGAMLNEWKLKVMRRCLIDNHPIWVVKPPYCGVLLSKSLHELTPLGVGSFFRVDLELNQKQHTSQIFEESAICRKFWKSKSRGSRLPRPCMRLNGMRVCRTDMLHLLGFW